MADNERRRGVEMFPYFSQKSPDHGGGPEQKEMFSTWLITQPLPGLVVASFNRPKRANALSSKSYLVIFALLQEEDL